MNGICYGGHQLAFQAGRQDGLTVCNDDTSIFCCNAPLTTIVIYHPIIRVSGKPQRQGPQGVSVIGRAWSPSSRSAPSVK
jgi:hypothetical protein